MNNKLQELIANRATMETLRAYVEDHHIRSLRDELVTLVNQGITSTDEAVRILYNVD